MSQKYVMFLLGMELKPNQFSKEQLKHIENVFYTLDRNYKEVYYKNTILGYVLSEVSMVDNVVSSKLKEIFMHSSSITDALSMKDYNPLGTFFMQNRIGRTRL